MSGQIMKVERVGHIATPVLNILTPEQAAKVANTTTMIFDKPVLLTVRHDLKIQFPAGVNEVPDDLVDHWYLKAHGVTKRPVRSK